MLNAKYLGVTIDSKLSWSKHIQEITTKANKVKGFQVHIMLKIMLAQSAGP